MKEVSDLVKTISHAEILWGVSVILLGILAMLLPVTAGVAASGLIAVILIASGIVRTIYAFEAPKVGTRLLKFIFGGITILCGTTMLYAPLFGLQALTLLVVGYLLFDGIVAIILAFKSRPSKDWGWTLVTGISSFLLAALIWVEWPLSGIYAIGFMVGANLVLTGASMIISGSLGENASDFIKYQVSQPAAKQCHQE